ncbi:beta-glucosidase [uncultured Amnibacterium sp.]|uniref:beta-glucosidase family protein n=1 Tax=uncultured Amnibacterium sp. TaxID=1631851 RepID=UPI0035CAFAF5
MTDPIGSVEFGDDEFDGLIGRLSLEEKVLVLTGASAWATAPLPSIGLAAMVLSDGPSGVRGATWDERDPSLGLPSGTALSASWDRRLARRYGGVAGGEARRKGVAVVLGPMINLHRSPLGGRSFEAFSEDPLLTAELAAAYVEGIQERGVAATLKHYIANDSETDRFTTDVHVDDRPLRELYLAAFERGVRDAGAWAVMSAYNSVNGVTNTENDLLTTPLTTEWGFDGVVVSDWTAVRSLASALTPQDLAMPGPEGPWGAALVAAVRDGRVPEQLVDAKVRRILRLAARVGALDGYEAAPVGVVEDGVAFARSAAAEGMVLLRNDGLLPLAVASLTRIAVIGENAVQARVQGGGSATVLLEHAVSPLEGLRSALVPTAIVEHRLGAKVLDGFAAFEPDRMTNPVTGEPGARVTYLDADGETLYAEDRFAGLIMEFEPSEINRRRASMVFQTRYRPDATEELLLGFASPGTGKVFVDGVLVLDATIADEADQVQGFFFPPFATTPVAVTADQPIDLRFEFVPGAIIDGVPGSITVTFGTESRPPSAADGDDLIGEAVALAREADVAVVVVGTTEQLESEGYDRTDLRLPGRQDELVHAVAAANSRTIVVVNAGAPVEMPWRDEVAAVVLVWFGGQELGHALADVLLGRTEPGGRLPTTWPARLADAPVVDVTPVDGVVRYDEGIHIGYRAWLRADAEPAYPFGHGLGYTTWTVGPARVEQTPTGVDVVADVTNSGGRHGKQVLQAYARRPDSAVDRPERWLIGFDTVRADPGETRRVRISAPLREFAYWDDGWIVEPGDYEVRVGTSVIDLGEPVVAAIDEAAAPVRSPS